MPTLQKIVFDNCLEITIIHKDIVKNYEQINEETGKGTKFIGIKINGYKYGFSVSTKKYDTEKTEYNIKGRKGKLVIKIPIIKKEKS